ncbi:MAG: aromatic amino acid lyase [Myxococcota bacterium]
MKSPLELDRGRAYLDDQVIAEQELPQDPYSVRCVPQLFGAVLDALAWHNDTAETELNSGFMGAPVTASALVAEMHTTAFGFPG